MPTRNRRRFAQALLDTSLGSRILETPLPPSLAGCERYSLALEGAVFDFYATSTSTHDPIPGPDANVWFGVGSSVGSFNIGLQAVQECGPGSGLSQGVLADNAGNIWFGQSFGASQIGRSSTGCVIDTYPTAGATVDLALGPDGNIYFSDAAARLGSATPAGIITEFPTTYGTVDPIVGPGNTIWFGEFGPRIGRLSLDGSPLQEWTVTAAGIAGSLVPTPDGSVWYGTDITIGRITPAGEVEEYPIGRSGAFNLLYGPDGNIWFGCQFTAQVGMVTPAGQVSLYTIDDLPMGMAFGPDNKLYVGQLSYFLSVVDQGGSVNNVPLTGAIPFAPHVGPDGNIWFPGNPYLNPGVPTFTGRMTPGGVLTEFQTYGYPNSFLNGYDGVTMYMGMSSATLGVAHVI
ncbi:MAG TPA: hypothetical protein VHI13_10950 [Candidatus Kapabacteria bacterium]|nr:hypothetical protein [Candidatus Kapabacteria bacterium]